MAPPRAEGESALARLLLSGAESIALDLKKPSGRAVLHKLLESADVLLESFRPGTLRRLGLDPEDLREQHPRLVLCSLSGWGRDGPHASRAGHDLSYLALAGTLASIHDQSAVPPAPIADLTGAWSAVTAILAALLERQRTGRGRFIDVSLYDAALHSNLTAWTEETRRPHGVGEALPLTGAYPCYRLYRCRDGGHVALTCLEPHFWQRFCRAVGRPDLERHHLDDREARPRSHRKLEDLFLERTRDEWAELFAREDLPAEPVLSAREAAEHPQAQARGVLLEEPGRPPRLGFPARFDGDRPAAGRRFPDLGGDTRRLVAEAGLDSGVVPRPRSWSGVGRRFSLKRWVGRWLAR